MRTPSITIDMLYNYFQTHPREVTTAELVAHYTAGWDLPPRALADITARINTKCSKLAKQQWIVKLDLNLWIWAECENITNLE